MTAVAEFDPSVALNGRKDLPSESWSYKLASGGSYGMDVSMTDELDLNENEMSVWIPFADGTRRDGVGDLLEVGGIDTSRHRKNPICLFDHGKSVTLPIGLSEDPVTHTYTIDIDVLNKIARAKCFFYSGRGLSGVDTGKDYDHAVFCEQLFDLIAKRYIRAGSIGYQVVKAYQLQPDYETGVPQGLHLLQTLMLEASAVVLPANGDTVRKALALPKVCGKPLSSYLVKSLTPYAEAKKVQFGYEGKGKADYDFDVGDVVTVRNSHDLAGKTGKIVGVQSTVSGGNRYEVKIGSKTVLIYRDDLKHKKSMDAKSQIAGDLDWLNEEQAEAEHKELSPLSDTSKVPPVKWKPGVGAVKAAKSLDDLRKKYKRAKGKMLRLRKSAAGTSIVYVRNKDLHKAKAAAEKVGLKCSYAGAKGNLERLKLTGDDSAIEEVAKSWGRRRVKMLNWSPAGHMVQRSKDSQGRIYEITEGGDGTFVLGIFDGSRHRPLNTTWNEMFWNEQDAKKEAESVANKKSLGTQAMPSSKDGICCICQKPYTKGQQVVEYTKPTFGDQTPGLAHEKCAMAQGVKELKGKNMQRYIKAAPDDMATPPDVPTNTDDVVQDAPPEEEVAEEKLGAQALRRLHQDASILMQEYDEILELLENDTVKVRLQSKLETLEEELTSIEEEFAAEYADLDPLEGAGEVGDKELDDGGPGEEALNDEIDSEESDDGGEGVDDVEIADSTDDDDEVPVEEAAEGMLTKDLKNIRKKYRKSQDDEDKEDKSLGLAKAVCKECGPGPCTCSKKTLGQKNKSKTPGDEAESELEKANKDMDLVPGPEAEPGNEAVSGTEEYHDKLQDHETGMVHEAKDFLGELGGTQEFGHDHRLKAYHHAESLDGITNRLSKAFTDKNGPIQATADDVPVEGSGAGDEAVSETEMGSLGEKSWFVRLTSDGGTNGKAWGYVNAPTREKAIKAFETQARQSYQIFGQIVARYAEPAGKSIKNAAYWQTASRVKGLDDMDEDDKGMGSAAGTAIGAVAGGPVGAAVGGAVGGMLDSKSAYPHHEKLTGSSGFLRNLSNTHDFGEQHRMEAKSWHKALSDIDEPSTDEDELEATPPEEAGMGDLEPPVDMETKDMDDDDDDDDKDEVKALANLFSRSTKALQQLNHTATTMVAKL